MKYDFEFINSFLNANRIDYIMESERKMRIVFSDGIEMFFINDIEESSSRVHFGFGWHNHDEFIFSNSRGDYVEIDYIELLDGLMTGSILICSHYTGNTLVDRFPVYRENFEIDKYIKEDEEFRIKRLKIKESA